MIRTQSATYTRLGHISAGLSEAPEARPHPSYANADEVSRFVQRLQAVQWEVSDLLSDKGVELSSRERTALEQKRETIDAAVGRQALLAGKRVSRDREGGLETLHALYGLGRPIERPLDGKHRGDLVALCLFPPLDATGWVMSSLWFPWLGKRFDAEAQTGVNLFTPGARIAGRLMWPTYSGYRPAEPGIVTAFDFSTYTGAGVQDPGLQVLKLDYDLPANPRFLVRSVLDEITQITDNYYLGKAFLRGSDGGHRLAAFFAVRNW